MANDNQTRKRECPNCQRPVVFAPDGRSLLCEQCGWQQAVVRQQPIPAEIAASQRISVPPVENDGSRFRDNSRDLLIQGIAAAKAGDRDEAFFYLQWVLRKQATDKEQAEAWLWLGQLYDEPEHQRECLAYALALDPTNAAARRRLAILDGRLSPEEIVDPNRITPESTEEPREASAEQFYCPRCSGRMNYVADDQALVCEFCHYQQALSGPGAPGLIPAEYGMGALEQDFIAALATARGHVQPIAMRSFHCQGCGVEFALGPETLSITCPYCDSVYVTEAAETREILPPQGLIPFALSQDSAKQALLAWLKQQKISRVRVSPIVGIYLPVWTFDIGGEIKWRGRERKGDEWVHVSGEYYILQDDVLVPASLKLSPRLAKTFQDFDLTELVTYDNRYLADWPAERYQITLADASLLARKKVLDQLRRQPVALTGGRPIRDLGFGFQGMMIDSYKLILLPVWIAHYRLEDRWYDVIINGQIGRIRGEKTKGVVGNILSWLKGE